MDVSVKFTLQVKPRRAVQFNKSFQGHRGWLGGSSAEGEGVRTAENATETFIISQLTPYPPESRTKFAADPLSTENRKKVQIFR